ncbi:hypothetical protein RSAG8_05109, partial [Rhizoctonia solani AG-8 WAC10335]
MASTSAEVPEGRDLAEWQQLEDTDDLERQGLTGRRWKGKSKDVDYGPDVPLSSIGEERTAANGSSKSYPPLSEEVAEERAVMENLKRWENTERLRRKAARDSRTSSVSSVPSPITELTRRASQALFRRSSDSTRGNATILRTESPTALDDLEQQRASAPPTRAKTDDAARNPFQDPAGAGSEIALVTPTTTNPFRPVNSPEERPRSDSTSTITGATPVQPVPRRPTLETLESSFLGESREGAHVPAARPIDIPTTPAPQHVYEGGGAVPARISGPEGMRIRRTVADAQEDEEELEREKRDGRWWTDWLCGLKERRDPGGQGGLRQDIYPRRDSQHASGQLYLALGGSGGSRIFGAIAQTIVNLDRGMNISGAVEAPRVHDQLFPTLVSIESEFGERELEGLKQRGHNTSVFDINLGVAEIQAVTLDEDGHIFAASDSRKNGIAAGW